VKIPLLTEGTAMRYDIHDTDSAIEFENMWKRLWLSLIVVLAAMIGLGVASASFLNAYDQAHCRYTTRVPAILRQAGLF
jgi:uncharacterized membrane protein